VLVNAVNATLENAKIALNGIGVYVAANVFVGAMGDGPMESKVVADIGVSLRLIGHEITFERDVPGHDAAQSVGADIGDMERAHATIALDKRQDRLFHRGRQEGFAASLSANIGLIHFHGLTSAAHGFGKHAAMLFHGLPNAMGEEPRGFQADAKHPLKLAGADTLLAGAHEVDGLKPKMKLEVAILENGPDADSEWLAAGVALAETRTGGLARQPTDLLASSLTMRANRTIGPKLGFYIFEGDFLVMEARSGKNGISHGLPRC